VDLVFAVFNKVITSKITPITRIKCIKPPKAILKIMAISHSRNKREIINQIIMHVKDFNSGQK